MADIFHHLQINAAPQDVFQAISTPAGVDAWWSKRSSGGATEGATWELWFGPSYDWRATVSRCVPNQAFEWQMTSAHRDWQGTRVGFELSAQPRSTQVRFHHLGWPEDNDH